MGFFLSLLIGLALGLLGGGGSILTVPLLVYVFGLPATRATGLSLFVVGVASALGAAIYWKRGEVDWRVAGTFGIPASIVAFASRAWFVPLLPEHLWGVHRDKALLVAFSMLMLVVGIKMLLPRKAPTREIPPYVLGVAVGLLAGLLGAGGGFLIVPALLLSSAMSMKTAVGTSLVIIAFQSLVAFGGESLRHPVSDWRLLGGVTLAAGVGVLAGLQLTRIVNGGVLRPLFGWFLAAIGVGIFAKELFLS